MQRPRLDVAAPREPLYPAEELYGIVPADPRKPYDVREVIARIVDGSEFDEFKALYGTTLVTGFARIWRLSGRHRRQQRHPVLARARSRARTSSSCAASAASRCVFLQNITGFMVGSKYEAGGIAKDGAKMVTAVACADGAEVHGDHRRQLRRRQLRHVRPRLRAALPVDVAERRISVMGGEQAAARAGHGASATARGAAARAGAPRTRRRSRRRSASSTKTQGHPYYASARLWDDGIIDPGRHAHGARPGARRRALNAPIEPTRFGMFRM